MVSDIIKYAGFERRAFAVMRRLAFIDAECIRAAPDLVPLAPKMVIEPESVGNGLCNLSAEIEGPGRKLFTDGRWVCCRVCCKSRKCGSMKKGRLPCCAGGLAALGRYKRNYPSKAP